MKATFIELPPFERHRQNYLNDASYREYQIVLMENHDAGNAFAALFVGMANFAQSTKRDGLRVIYYWWLSGKQFWLFTCTTQMTWMILPLHKRKS